MKTPILILALVAIVTSTTDASAQTKRIPVKGVGMGIYTAFGSWESDLGLKIKYNGEGSWFGNRSLPDYNYSAVMIGDTDGPTLYRYTCNILYTGTDRADREFICDIFIGCGAYLLDSESLAALRPWLMANIGKEAQLTSSGRTFKLDRYNRMIELTMTAAAEPAASVAEQP